MKMHYRNWIALGVLAAAACGGDAGDKATDTAATKASTPTVSPDEYRKAQARIADSVLNQIKGADAIVKDLGKGYEVGSVRLRDSIAVLATKSNCFLDGRQSDPYLAGTVSFYIFMSVVGTNVVRVQENATKWTSTAGNIVNSCLNVASKNWTFDPSFGKPANYIVQVQFK